MHEKDVIRLFDLLEQLYQGKRRSRDKVTVAIWAEVLKHWSYKQVRDAAVRRARENRFFPDPSELAAYLPAIPPPEQQTARCAPLSPAEMARMNWAREWRREWRAGLRGRGLPSISEALEAGMSLAEWNAKLTAAGVWRE